MPLYVYKAITEKGQVVSNKVEALSKYELLEKLKKNGFTPINVKQIKASNKIKLQNIKRKKNAESQDSALKKVRENEELNERMSKNSVTWKKVKEILFASNKITNREIVIFTQNLYLLKKANFNNIHALSTIIETTKNPMFKSIIEDILLGVESGETMYSTMEYYDSVFPPIYVNIIKVGELSRFFNKSIRTGN